MLRRLVYVSTAALSLDQPDIDAILAQARRFNAANAVTGLLLYNGRNFIQALEGAPETVTTLYARICADARHSGVVTVRDEPIADRDFPDWAMAYAAARPGAGDLSSLLPASLPHELKKMFGALNAA